MNTLNIVESIFFTALEKETPAARAAYLDDACKGDANMRRYIDRMLNAHPKLDGFLQQSPAPRVDEKPATIEPPPIEERPGTIIGSYKLLQQLGEGGFGVVFMAEQEQPVRRKVALKIIKPGMDSKQVVARFEAERQALALMDHPNIARVFDGGTTDSGRPYFVMELVKGTPITEFCDKNRLTPRERLELFIPVCQAVQHAHQKGIIHRDIKPSNVLITMYDGKPVPKVIDFGIAKAIAEKLTEQTLFTRVGQVIGTLEYMSPEQASLNALDVDTRADVYALGVLLYELLTGSTPLNKDRIQGVAFLEMLRLIREEEPPKPSTRLSQSGDALTSYAVDRRTDRQKLPKLVKGELDWITMKALEKDRTRRYDSASAMAADVQRYLKDEQVEACPPSISYRFQKYARKHKTAIAMTSMAASLLLFGIVATGWQAIRATIAEDDATTQRNAVVAAELQVRAERDDARAANVQLQVAQEDMRRTLYFARSNLLQNAWDGNNPGQVFQLLDQQRPGPGERDLRGFEWYYRDRLCHQDLLTITGLGEDWNSLTAPVFSPDGKYVAAPVEDNVIPRKFAIFDLVDGRERTRLQVDSKEKVGGVVWSPDSKRVLLSRFFNFRAKSRNYFLCDAADGHQIYQLEHSPEWLEAGTKNFGSSRWDCVFSPDGKYFAIGPPGIGIGQGKMPVGTIVYDAATGKEIRRFEDPMGRARRFAFSPDGRRLAIVFQQKSDMAGLTIWDIAGGEELFSTTVPAYVASDTVVRFSPDGNRVAVISGATPKHTGIFTAWDIANGKVTVTFPLRPEGSDFDIRNGIKFVLSPDGTRLAVWQNAAQTQLRVYNTETGQIAERLGDTAPLNVVQFSPDGKMLAAGGRDGMIRVWDLGGDRAAKAAPSLLLRGHTSGVMSLHFHPEGHRLFSYNVDGVVKVWDVARREGLATITMGRSAGPATSPFASPFAFNATSGRVVTVGVPISVVRGKIAGKVVPDNEGNLDPADTEKKSEITIWDVTGRALDSFAGPIPVFGSGAAKLAIDLSHDGTRLAIVSYLGDNGKSKGAELHVIDADTGKEIFTHKVDPLSDRSASLAFSRDGKQIALGFTPLLDPDFPKRKGSTGPIQVRLLNALDGAENQRITLPSEFGLHSLAFSPDGKKLVTVTGGSPSKVNTWDARTGERLIELDDMGRDMSADSLVYSDDGSRLAGVVRAPNGGKHDVVVWDAATGKKLLLLPGHSRQPANVAFSPDGRRIATVITSITRLNAGPFGNLAGNDVKLWDAATGNELMTLKDLGRNPGRFLSFSPDGKRLYAVGQIVESGTPARIEIRTWDATPRAER